MKNLITKMLLLSCLVGLLMLWYSCEKASETIEPEKVDVSFNVSFEKYSELKATKAYELIDAENVILTILEADGTATDYTQFELEIHRMGSEFVTRKLALPLGSYQVTEFYIIDQLDSIIFASPLEGSLMAQNIDDPLPVLFNVVDKKSETVDVEVLSTEKLKPEDFGLISFPLIEVETFQFLINVSELGANQLLISDLAVTNGSYIYEQSLDSIVDNIVTIKDSYVEYILSVESDGYYSFTDTFTNIELKTYDTLPLIIELIPGPIAHYPFNGNANDVSGNGNNGVVLGTVNYNNIVQFGSGICPNTGSASSGVDLPTTIVDSEKGCIELWTEFYFVPVAFSHGVYGFVNVGHWTHNVLAFYWHNTSSNLAFDITFNGTGVGVAHLNFSPNLNTPVHMAAVWDRNGINGSGDYLRIYVDGILVQANNTTNTWGTDNTSGNFRVATPWDSSYATDRYTVDNMKIWSYAKTNFSDRFVE